ncbi:oligosaccharide flippase family protein [Chelativorans sp. J32]|uniref:oligosaccharide flippase family protein n=1 Tax=Chelativorans sp. J32 TaxID=935840 RepID=UPI000482F1B6|nr:oligosaccharide flippase family protein [Chelativorans sp. J32]
MAIETERLEGAPKRRRSFSFRFPSIIGSGLWALSAKFASQVSQLTAFIVAAHVLTPAQFGLFAFCSAVAVFLVMLAEGGWAEFVMKSSEGEAHLNQIASMSMVSGLFFMIVGLLAAGILHEVFDNSWEASLLALFACWILPAGLTTVYDGVLVHRGELKRQAMIRIAAEAAGLALTVFGLRTGWNVFALAAGRLMMQLVILAGSIMAIGFIGFAKPSRPVVREVLRFSQQIIFNRLIVFFRSYSGTLAVGGFLGLAEAGYYRAAERIVAAFSELVGEPARMLGWLVFRRAREEQDKGTSREDQVSKAGSIFFPILIAIAAPVYLGLAMVSGGFVEVALGEAWRPAALLVGVLAAKQLLLATTYATEPLLAVRGNLRALAPVALFNALVSVFLIMLLSTFGVVAVALGQCVAAAIASATSIWVQQRYGGVDWREIAKNSALLLLALGAMVAVVFYVGRLADLLELRPVFVFFLQVGAGAVTYLAAVLSLWKFAGLAWLHWSTRGSDDPL